jgi:acetyl-CoA synthetase
MNYDDRISELQNDHDAPTVWQHLSTELLAAGESFDTHRCLFDAVYVDWDSAAGPAPAWLPSVTQIAAANVTTFMHERNLDSHEDQHRWSVDNRDDFWASTIDRLGIQFCEPFTAIVDPASDAETPRWLPGASLNIVDSCFAHASDSPAIIFQDVAGGPLARWSLAELEMLTNRVANGLVARGLQAGDAVAIDMPMTPETVAMYLGIIKMGGVVISIADSFAADEIATRLRLGKAKAIFTQDIIQRGAKRLPLYARVVEADAPPAIVIAAGDALQVELRPGDCPWHDFIGVNDQFESVPGLPGDAVNILFSSGTTGDPKAIPFTQTTPIKCAADAWYHHDIHPGDVLAWPTNLGWMMGPWLIFAALINRSAIALFPDSPVGTAFGKFVQAAGVTMLGVVPSLVRAWRESGCMEGLDWSKIRAFSSTGECSNADDMLYLMWLAEYKPVIEYCGGTEIGGGYITGTVVRPAAPATFNTLALGVDAVILDEAGQRCENGELFLIPPSIGLSNELLNRDHHEVYFSDTPNLANAGLLRRHGDQIERLSSGYFRAHGRVDDTMNLGGIKTSSAEVERVVGDLPEIVESAAIAVGGGPSQLVFYVIVQNDIAAGDLRQAMQTEIHQHLNPLFRISDVVITDTLPRTASNKVMRRVLRDQYEAGNR